jgi:hypothetical protein
MRLFDGTSGPEELYTCLKRFRLSYSEHTSKRQSLALYATYQMCGTDAASRVRPSEDVAADQPAHNNNSKTRSARPVVQTGVSEPPGDIRLSQRGDPPHASAVRYNMSAQCHGRRLPVEPTGCNCYGQKRCVLVLTLATAQSILLQAYFFRN